MRFPVLTYLKHGLLAIVCMLMVCASVASKPVGPSSDGNAANGRELLESKRSQKGLAQSEKVLLSYFNAILGDRSDLESVMLDGSYRSGGVDVKVQVIAKRPGMLRMVFESGQMEQKMLYRNGEYYTSLQRASSQTEKELTRLLFQLEADLYMLFWQYEISGLEHISLLERYENVDRQSCYLVENRRFPGVRIIHYIDARLGVERARTASVTFDGTAYMIRLQYRYDGNREAPDGSWPEAYSLTINQEPRSEARFDQARMNTGLTPWMFQMPAKTISLENELNR